jgi:hypothetical protein
MLIDEYVWYNKVVYDHPSPIKQVRDFTKSSKNYRDNLKRTVEAFRKRPDSDFLPAK